MKATGPIDPAEFAAAAKVRLKNWFPTLTGPQLDRCEIYIRELLRFNKTLNLVSPGTVTRIDALHFADSIRAWTFVEPKIPVGSLVYDFGTGNGLPGLLFAALAPDREFKLLDRDQRKLEFCKHVIAEMKLTNASIRNVDVGELAPGSVQFAVSRGFASVFKSLQLKSVFARGAQFFMMKGEGWAVELAALPPASFSVWKPEMIGQYALPDNSATELVVIQCTKLIN